VYSPVSSGLSHDARSYNRSRSSLLSSGAVSHPGSYTLKRGEELLPDIAPSRSEEMTELECLLVLGRQLAVS
jgi:hypothetical protein